MLWQTPANFPQKSESSCIARRIRCAIYTKRSCNWFRFPLKLFGGHTLFAGADHIDRQKPLGKRKVRIMEYGAGSYRVLITAVQLLTELQVAIARVRVLKISDPVKPARQSAQFLPA